ncbi:isoprenyl transferase [Kitasatospora sp. NPDC048365]|uniref:isoprenyl transferase n=1 Tax=Kitasatospora sp. NPDC048365 TaxID=3364050 RepID=UPI0037132D2F
MPLLPAWARNLLLPVYERRVIRGLDGLPRPKNVGIMLDGNRRWARAAGHRDVVEGYRVGGAKVEEFLTWCADAGVEHVTLFMLSDDNLGRPAEQLVPLLGIIQDTVAGLALPGRPWRVHLIGSLDLLPGDLAAAMKQDAASTTDRDGLRVDVAVGYGGRREIVDAVRAALRHHIAAGGDPADLADTLDVEHISANLYSDASDQADLIIRTSGEQRLSGFLLWQSAYAEMYWVDVYWPAFRRVDLLRALRSFGQRERRYGR